LPPMDSAPTTSSILDTLRTVEFRLGLKGYNVDEVDEYLDRAAQDAEALQETLRQLNERLRQASDRIVQLEREVRDAAAEPRQPAAAPVPAPAAVAPAPVAAPMPVPTPVAAVDLPPSDETLQRTLVLAQKFVDQIKRESEAEAAATIANAQQKARASMAEAEAAAAALQADSQRQVRDEVTRLEATRTELASDVESMARHLEAERNRLRDALTEILNWVDENVQPANALMGVRPKGAPAPKPAAIGSASNESPSNGAIDVDGQPTLSLESVGDATESGLPRTN
jgi:DivIVA domain-containing protein